MQSQKTENYAKAYIKAPLHRPAPPDPATMPNAPPKKTPSPPLSQSSPNTLPQATQRPANIPAGIYPPKINNENARTASFAPLWYLYDKLWTDLTPCSGVPIVDSKTSN